MHRMHAFLLLAVKKISSEDSLSGHSGRLLDTRSAGAPHLHIPAIYVSQNKPDQTNEKQAGAELYQATKQRKRYETYSTSHTTLFSFK